MAIRSRITIPKDVLFRQVGDEAVILSMATGKYYGLDSVGTRMWTLLAENGAIEPTLCVLLQEYDAPEAQLRTDLLNLVENLVSNRLVEINEAQDSYGPLT